MRIDSRASLPFDVSDSRTIDIECFPQQSVPYVVKLLLRRTYVKSSFEPPNGSNGRDMIVRAIVSIYQGCVSPTAMAVDRLYRMLDNAINGTNYTTFLDENGVQQANPPIPIAPYRNLPPPSGMYVYSEQSLRTIQNALLGITSAGFPDNRVLRDMLQQIIDKASGGELDDDILAELVQVVALLG